jgi:hypothetical protein
MYKKIFLTESQFTVILEALGIEPNEITTKLDEYKKAAHIYPLNAIAQIMYLIKRNLNIKSIRKQAQGGPSKSTRVWNGNTIETIYNPSTNGFVVIINGKVCFNGKVGQNTLFNAIASIIEADIRGQIEIKRPNGRTIVNDKRELSVRNMAKNGIALSARIPQMLIKYGNIAKQGGQNKPVLNDDEFDYFLRQGMINASDFIDDRYNHIHINTAHPKTKIVSASKDFANAKEFDKFIANIMHSRGTCCVVNTDIGSVYLVGNSRVLTYLRGQIYNVTDDFNDF